jgi:TRAP-type mannitol/chloroaromatic compound transport system substrate-binding protein
MFRRLDTAIVAAGVALAAALATTADAQDRVHWKMQSAFPSNLPHSGVAAKRLEAMVDRLSGGNFQLKFYEPGAQALSEPAGGATPLTGQRTY